jgi:hypothetical protein
MPPRDGAAASPWAHFNVQRSIESIESIAPSFQVS